MGFHGFMQVFVYEYLTGGGCLAERDRTDWESLLVEGRAMICALAADFASLPGVRVVTLRDARLPPLHRNVAIHERPVTDAEHAECAFRELAAASTWTLLIAPETEGVLQRRAERVLAAGGRLLSPDPNFIALTADKHRTLCHLEERGIPVPPGGLLDAAHPQLPAQCFLGRGGARDGPWPVVVKPVDGCGSQGVRLVADQAAWDRLLPHWRKHGGAWRVERRIEGLAASVGVLCGPAGHHALPACQQCLTDDGRFRYRGGRTPLPPGLEARARRLALAALAALPGTCGYVGVDLVLGNDPAGHEDRVIEINPRLTTSYVGLRHAVEEPLAGAMLRVAQGAPWAWRGSPRPVQFTADGCVQAAADALGTGRW